MNEKLFHISGLIIATIEILITIYTLKNSLSNIRKFNEQVSLAYKNWIFYLKIISSMGTLIFLIFILINRIIEEEELNLFILIVKNKTKNFFIKKNFN